MHIEDRLTHTDHGDADGSPAITRTYTPDGLPKTISTSSIARTLDYNNRRLMTRQTFAFVGGSSYVYTHGINANGHRHKLGYAGGLTVDYAPNALGQPTRVGNFVTGVGYHRNGAVTGYIFGNGKVFSATLNSWGLPSAWQHQGVSHDLYSYDANGNVTAISDQMPGAASSRSMAYDGLDRLRTAQGRWGAGTFGYDALDNLRSTTVGTRTTTSYLNPSNLITSLAVNGSALDLHRQGSGLAFCLA